MMGCVATYRWFAFSSDLRFLRRDVFPSRSSRAPHASQSILLLSSSDNSAGKIPRYPIGTSFHRLLYLLLNEKLEQVSLWLMHRLTSSFSFIYFWANLPIDNNLIDHVREQPFARQKLTTKVNASPPTRRRCLAALSRTYITCIREVPFTCRCGHRARLIIGMSQMVLGENEAHHRDRVYFAVALLHCNSTIQYRCKCPRLNKLRPIISLDEFTVCFQRSICWNYSIFSSYVFCLQTGENCEIRACMYSISEYGALNTTLAGHQKSALSRTFRHYFILIELTDRATTDIRSLNDHIKKANWTNFKNFISTINLK